MIHLAEAILVAPISVLMAAWHAHLIKQERNIDHPLWALVYGFLIAAGLYWQRTELHSIWQIAFFGIACAAGRLPMFNIFLNLFRGKAWNYTSTETTSLTDHIEARLFGQRQWYVDILCVVIFIPLQFFI